MKKYIVLCGLIFYAITLCNAFYLQEPHAVPKSTEEDSAFNKSLIEKRHARDEPPDCDIVFPDRSSAKPRLPAKPCLGTRFLAQGKGRKCIDGVCGDAVDYPYEQVERIKHKLTSYNNLFGKLDGANIFAPRGGEAEANSLCGVNIHTIYPKTLKNDKEVEKFIVNVEGHTQGLVLETCVEKATCMFSNYFPSAYTSECIQKYSTRRLMALNEDGNPAFDSFVVPSCCLCMIRHVKV